MLTTKLNIIIRSILLAGIVLLASCRLDPEVKPGDGDNNEQPTPYTFVTPKGFPQPKLPADNPMTVEGIELGRMLFYDPLLSRDQSMACATCHRQENAFATNNRVEVGITGAPGNRSSMPIFNLAFHQAGFFWDGRAATLEDQVLQPVVNPIEMNSDWDLIVGRLKEKEDYVSRFNDAFPGKEITKYQAAKALAQFLRTIVSADSKYDKYLRGEVQLTQKELNGKLLFDTPNKGECFHCHDGNNFQNLAPDLAYTNNGLDEANHISEFKDFGKGGVTGNPSEYGMFKVGSLRNLQYTRPFMHDGRFSTIDQVIQHYKNGGKESPTIDGNMASQHPDINNKTLHLDANEMDDLIAFLNTLNDQTLITNPAFSDPFKK